MFLDARFIVVTLIKLDLMILYKETHQWQRQNEPVCYEITVKEPAGAKQIINDLIKDSVQ